MPVALTMMVDLEEKARQARERGCKVSTSSVIVSSWGMMNPVECSGYFQGI